MWERENTETEVTHFWILKIIGGMNMNKLEQLLSELEKNDDYREIVHEWRKILHEMEKKGMLSDD